MDMNNVNIEEIVKQVLSGMTGTAPAAAQTAAPAAPAQGGIPKTARGNDDRKETLRTSGISASGSWR